MKINFKSETSKNMKTGFDSLPEGIYDVRVTKATVGMSQKGNEMISMELTVEDGKYKNRKLFHNIVVQDNEVGETILYNILKAVGSDLITEDDVDLSDVTEVLENSSLVVYVEPSSYNGKPTNKIKEFRASKNGVAKASMFA